MTLHLGVALSPDARCKNHINKNISYKAIPKNDLHIY